MTICSGLLAGSFILFYYIFDNKYFDAIKYTPILILSAFFMAISQFFGGIQIALKQPKQNGITTIAGATTNILVHILLIPLIGLFAASVSTLVSNIIIAVLRMRLVKDFYTVKLTNRMLIMSICTIYFFICSYLYRFMTLNVLNAFSACILFLVMNKNLIISSMPRLRK